MGLRQSLDEGAGEIGDDIGEAIPSTPTELRQELPTDVDELPAEFEELPLDDDSREATNGEESDGSSIDVLVEDTPLDQFL